MFTFWVFSFNLCPFVSFKSIFTEVMTLRTLAPPILFYFPDCEFYSWLNSLWDKGPLSYSFLNLSLFFFLGLFPKHEDVPRLGVESELQLLASITAPATWDPSHICSLHHSWWQWRSLTQRAKPGIKPTSSWILVRFDSTTGIPCFVFCTDSFNVINKVCIFWHWDIAFVVAVIKVVSCFLDVGILL